MRYYFMLAREKGACHATQGPTGKHQVWVRRQKQEQEEGLGHVSIGFSAGQAGQGRGTSFGLARWNPSGSLWAVEVVSGGPVSTQIDFGGGGHHWRGVWELDKEGSGTMDLGCSVRVWGTRSAEPWMSLRLG